MRDLNKSRSGFDRVLMAVAATFLTVSAGAATAQPSVSPRDTADWAAYPGLWRALATHWRSAAVELRNSMWRGGYLEECRKYCPSLTLDDLAPYPAGIRAQAVMRDGALAHDFLFVGSERQLHVCNAPSPAATSAIAIGEMIADRLLGG